ncbi:MAG: hypothetical protein SVS85_02315 [Candidatus Nanohaloarchaea archaeon]|nr:hypothetical protein [Candidatus Nanohaloarchaea archaeon]
MPEAQPVTQRYREAEEAVESLPDPLVREPYPAIYNHVEQIMKYSGAKVFKYAALQILSPYAPKLTYAGENKRISINVLLIGNSGSGKTELMTKAREFSPLDKYKWIQKQTDKALQELVAQSDEGVELIINDMKTVMGDSKLLKTYESVIAEGIVKRDTARGTIDEDDVRAAMIGGAVPDDISNQIYGGLIFRVVPIEIEYDSEQQKEIGEHITQNVASRSRNGVTNDDISEFYDIIFSMIHGRFRDYPPIRGYEFEDDHRDRIQRGWNTAIDELQFLDSNVNLFRQLWDGFRFAALHALLNVHNRNIQKDVNEDGKEIGRIKLTDKDAMVGNVLMMREMDVLDGFLEDENIRDQLEELEAFKASGRYGLEGIDREP